MIDERLVPLVMATKGKLAGMKDARPSQVLAVKEEFAANLLAMMETARDGITDAEKIAAFDRLLTSQVDALTEAIQNYVDIGSYYQDEDLVHYAYEEVKQATLGMRIFDATNEFENLLSRSGRR